jgi:exonuclease VII small subunit
MSEPREERPQFEEAMAELEALVRRRLLAARLEDVAQRVEVLLRTSDGSLLTRPLPDEEE